MTPSDRQRLKDLGVSEALWEQFKQHRAELVKLKRGAKPFTPTAEDRAIGKLERLRDQGCDPVAVIDRSIDKGWEGLHPLPDAQRTAFKEARTTPGEDILTRSRRSWERSEGGPVRVSRVLDGLVEKLR